MSAPRPERKLAIVMVGLPARGKTYIARKIARYLSWLGHETRWFNVGNYRRERVGAHQEAAFFDPGNPEGRATRRALALAALDDLLAWLRTSGDVAIYDATNSTRERRDLVADRCAAAGVDVVFVESICDDPAVIEANIRETKLTSPDYAGEDPDAAVRDFRARIAHYERAYEPIDEDARSYVKLIDLGRQVVSNRMRGYLEGRLVFFLMNLHVTPRPIWLTRHGESAYNVAARIGGDAPLTGRGREYARHLAAFLRERAPGPLQVWTSTLRRTVETAGPLGRPTVQWRALDEIDAGICDGLTYQEIRVRLPDEFAARRVDKLRYRYPRGESYQDVIQRLEPVLIELERQEEPVLVIAHQAVIRALYGYFLERPSAEVPHLPIPLHTVLQLTPKAYGADVEAFPLGPPASGGSSS